MRGHTESSVAILGEQLHKIWQQLDLRQRVRLVISGLVVVLALTAVEIYLNRPKYCLLFDGVTEAAELERVVAELDQLKIRHRIGKNGTSIYVPQYQLYVVRTQLATRYGARQPASLNDRMSR